MGSAMARVSGTQPGAPLLAIVGHLDEIGLVVTHIDDDGFMSITGVGGWDPQILVGQRVELLTREGPVPGVVGKKPIHLLRDEERKKVPEMRDLHLDIGAPDGDAARAAVRIGDVAVIAGEPVELLGDRAISRSMDNRLGSFIALEAARLVAEAGAAPGDVAAIGAVQEEITFGGARTTAFGLQPAVAIAVDVTHATDAPGIEVKEQGKHELGGGAVIERGSIIHPMVVRDAPRRCRAGGHPLHRAGVRGPHGDRRRRHPHRRAGIPTGLVSIALRYMHSPVEMVQLSDIDACARLIAAFAQSLSPETHFVR